MGVLSIMGGLVLALITVASGLAFVACLRDIAGTQIVPVIGAVVFTGCANAWLVLLVLRRLRRLPQEPGSGPTVP